MAARDGAIYKRPDGIVIIDPLKAKDQDASRCCLPVWGDSMER